jgi:hypothetical protein
MSYFKFWFEVGNFLIIERIFSLFCRIPIHGIIWKYIHKINFNVKWLLNSKKSIYCYLLLKQKIASLAKNIVMKIEMTGLLHPKPQVQTWKFRCKTYKSLQDFILRLNAPCSQKYVEICSTYYNKHFLIYVVLKFAYFKTERYSLSFFLMLKMTREVFWPTFPGIRQITVPVGLQSDLPSCFRLHKSKLNYTYNYIQGYS